MKSCFYSKEFITTVNIFITLLLLFVGNFAILRKKGGFFMTFGQLQYILEIYRTGSVTKGQKICLYPVPV